MDDFLWENDRIAHRVYGPALVTKEGTNTSGIDIFMKGTSALVMDKFYKNGNYHRDHGEGLDAYDVGQSQGLGGLVVQGLNEDKKWYPSANFSKYKLLAKGPIRVAFGLKYDLHDAGGRSVGEEKFFVVDAGSDFTKILTRFHTVSPLGADMMNAVKPVIHANAVVFTDWAGRKKHNPKPYVLADGPVLPDKPETSGTSGNSAVPLPTAYGKNWLADWQSNRGNNGVTGVAVIVPNATEIRTGEGHWLIVSNDSHDPEQRIAYVGGGWSKGWYPTKESWLKAVEDFRKTLAKPVELSYGK
jgi:hypothetical protein